MAVLWLSADCATVHVRLRVLNEIFVDHLSFVGDGHSFRIVAKTWHLERQLPTQEPTVGVGRTSITPMRRRGSTSGCRW